MCHYSRSIQKIAGHIRYYPCPVIYNDERFDLGGTLEASFRRIYLGHKNCYDYCMKGRGATCRTQPLSAVSRWRREDPESGVEGGASVMPFFR